VTRPPVGRAIRRRVLASQSRKRSLIRYLPRALSEAVHIGATDVARALADTLVQRLERQQGDVRELARRELG
jgi:hypothetical protein